MTCEAQAVSTIVPQKATITAENTGDNLDAMFVPVDCFSSQQRYEPTLQAHCVLMCDQQSRSECLSQDAKWWRAWIAM
ncbi:hypothetical protein CEV32_4692 [Brucella rhizosphaerae]|uniref:Uncharacterized protein n=1 Tax=Brucella rhizosphaerae TaxID=571254 RepID=A0A256FKY1_9HYPH|nr:hypothetical protein CEV32_4692 [Brucella rhizosphaerae]